MDRQRKVMTQPATGLQSELKSSDDLPTFEAKGSGESSTYSSVLAMEGKVAATVTAKHAVGTPEIIESPEKRVSRLQSTHSGYSDSGIFESSSLTAKHLPQSRLSVQLRDMYSEYVEDSHFSVSTSYAEIQTSDSLEGTPALLKRSTLERSTSTSMFASTVPRNPIDPISPITPTNSTLQLVKMEELERAASDGSSSFAISSTPLLRRCHVAGQTGTSAATSGIFEAAGSILTESEERLGATPVRSQTLPQTKHVLSGQHHSESRGKPPLPKVFHKSSGSLKTKKQQQQKQNAHPARRAVSGVSLLSLFGFKRKTASLQQQQPATISKPPLTKISTLPPEKPEERRVRGMGTGSSTTPGWSASLYSSMSGDLGEVVRAHDDEHDTGASLNMIGAATSQETRQSSVLPQASHTACAKTTDQSMGPIVCAQAGLARAAADEAHAASASDHPAQWLNTTKVTIAGDEEMEPSRADADDEVIGISERNLRPISSREEGQLEADTRSISGCSNSSSRRRKRSRSGGEISVSNDSSSDSVQASWYRPHFTASDQEIEGGKKKQGKHRRWRKKERESDQEITAEEKDLTAEVRTKNQQTSPLSGKPDISMINASEMNPDVFDSTLKTEIPQQTAENLWPTVKNTEAQQNMKSEKILSNLGGEEQGLTDVEIEQETGTQPVETIPEKERRSEDITKSKQLENIIQITNRINAEKDTAQNEPNQETEGAIYQQDFNAGIVREVSLKAGPVVVDVPTVDIQASVPGDVELPSLDVKAPDLDGEMNVKADIQMPEAHLDIEPPATDMHVDAGGKFEIPSMKVKLPHPHLKFGASGKAKAPKVDVEMPQVDADLDVSGKVDVPSTKVVIDADTDLDKDAGGKIGGIGKMGGLKVKLPNAHWKMGKSGKVKVPKVDVEKPEVDAGLDVSGDVKLPSAGIDVNAEADLDVDAGGKIGLKKPKSPSFKLKLAHPSWKMGKSGKLKGTKVDLEMPQVDAGLDVSGDVEMPSAGIDVNADADLDVDAGGKIGLKKPTLKLPHASWKFGKSGKVKGPKLDVELPQVDAGLDVSGDVEHPSAGIDMNADADLDVDAGGKIGLKKPKLKLPHASWKMGKSEKVKGPKLDVELPQVDAGLDVSGKVDMPSTKLKLDVDTDVDVGADGVVDVHGKSPSFKFRMPKWHLDKSAKVEVPKVTAEFPELDAGMNVDTDIRLPEASLDIDVAKAGLDIDTGIVPEVSLKAGPVVVDVPTVDIQASVPGDVELPSLDVKAPDLDGEMNVKADIQMPEAHLDMEPPATDMHVNAGGKFEIPSMKVKLPHTHLKFGASGKTKSPKVDVEMPQVDADLDVSGKVDVPSTKVVIDADTDLDVDAGGKIGGIGKMGGLKVKMPKAHWKMGKFSGISSPVISADVPEVVVHAPVLSSPTDSSISVSHPAVSMSAHRGPFSQVTVVDSRVRSGHLNLTGFDDVDHGSACVLSGDSSAPPVASCQLSPPVSAFALSESESSEVESASDTPPFSSPSDFWAHSVTPDLGKSYGIHGGASLPRCKEEDLVLSEDLKKVGFRLRWPWSSQKATPTVSTSIPPQQRKISSSSSGVVEGSPPNQKRKRPFKPEKRKRKKEAEQVVPVRSFGRRDEDLGIQADISTAVLSPAPDFGESIESGQKRDWSWKRGARSHQPSMQVQVKESRVTPLHYSTPSKATPSDAKSKTHFAGLFKVKSNRKRASPVDVREPLQVSVEMRKPSSSSRGSSADRLQRQTWHAPSLNDTDGEKVRPPTPPLSWLPDADISKDLAVAYRRYYAYGSPLRKPRPWSTLDFPPRNCKFRNDDKLFPYAITPTKLPSCNWKTDEEYNVPYMDDDALPEEEPEWALGESRRTLTLATADATSFRTSFLAAGEPSEASSGLQNSPHTKKSRSLRAFSRSKKPAKEEKKSTKLTKFGMPPRPEDRPHLDGSVHLEDPGGQ